MPSLIAPGQDPLALSNLHPSLGLDSALCRDDRSIVSSQSSSNKVPEPSDLLPPYIQTFVTVPFVAETMNADSLRVG